MTRWSDEELNAKAEDLERWADDLEQQLEAGTAVLEWDGNDTTPRSYHVRYLT